MLLLFSILSIAMIFVPSVLSAKISGTVYDLALEPLKDVIVKINSTPEQLIVSKDGSYQFSIPQGSYIVSASIDHDGDKLASDEDFIISEDGDFVIDLILFPVLEFEDNITEPQWDYFQYKKKNNMLVLAIIFLLGALVVALLFILFYKTRQKQKPFLQEDYGVNDLLMFIKANDGRVSQKYLRREMPYSEAKISLMVTELESRGLIKKIKKGRGNVLILEKK